MTGSFSVPPPVVRPMLEANGDTTLLGTQGGVVQKSAGATVALEAYSTAQDGNQYGIKNAASGNILVATAAGEFIQTASGNVSSFTLQPDYALTIIRNATNTTNWIIQ